MKDNIIEVKPPVYIPYMKVPGALKELYQKEEKLNEDMGIYKPILINYYGLLLGKQELQEPNKTKNLILSYWKGLRDKRRLLWEKGVKVQKKIYSGLPGMDYKDCIKYVIHRSRLEIAQCKDDEWVGWFFEFHFNGIKFDFDPIIANPHPNLTRQTKELFRK